MRLDFEQVSIELKGGLNYLRPDPKWYIDPHAHSDYEIHFVTEGEGINRLRGGELDLYQGIVYVAPPGEVHAQSVNSAAPLGLYFLSFNFNGPNREGQEHIYLHLPMVTRKVEAITRLKQSDSLGDRFRSQLKIIELIWSVFEPAIFQANGGAPSSTELPHSSLNASRCTEQAIVYIQTHLLANPTVTEISATCHVSPRHLARLFSHCMDMSIHTFLERERFHWAAAKLKEGELSVQEISDLMNFSSSQYFSQWFKKHAQLSPSEFRQRHSPQ
ncbi:MAG: helix-turn-helix domain-containing protein [Bacilli bacterium]